MKRKKVISRVTMETASPEALEALANHKNHGHRSTNMKEIMLHSPISFSALQDAGYELSEALMKKGTISVRAVNIFVYEICHVNECIICGNCNKKYMYDLGIDWDTLEFTDEEIELLNFAEALKDPNHVPDEVYEPLQERYDEETLVLLITCALLMMASNYFNAIVGTEIDDYLESYLDKDPLAHANKILEERKKK